MSKFLPKTKPTWLELDFSEPNDEEWNLLVSNHELLLDNRERFVIFFGAKAELKRQEYGFLKAVLSKNGKKLSAENLMTEINSKGKEKEIVCLSHRIKSKIKSKLKEAIKKDYPDKEIQYLLNERNWLCLDIAKDKTDVSSISLNEDITIYTYVHSFDFEKEFKSLIGIIDGFYYTNFKHGRKNQKPCR